MRPLLILAAFSFVGLRAEAGFLNCESVFDGFAAQIASLPKQSRVDALLLNHAELFAGLSQKIQRSHSSEISVGYGRLHGSIEVLEEQVSFAEFDLAGVSVRKVRWPREGHSLDLIVRPHARMNDFEVVSLATEIDALAFLVAKKSNLPLKFTADPRVGDFLVTAGDVKANRESLGNREIRLGYNWKLVGLESLRSSREGDIKLVLRIRDEQTKQAYEITSRTEAHGMKVLASLLEGDVSLTVSGTSFEIRSSKSTRRRS